MNLKAQIEQQQSKIEQLQRTLSEEKRQLQQLLNERQQCAHEFEPPLKVYAHEGGQCIHCGINELYALTLKAQSN